MTRLIYLSTYYMSIEIMYIDRLLCVSVYTKTNHLDVSCRSYDLIHINENITFHVLSYLEAKSVLWLMILSMEQAQRARFANLLNRHCKSAKQSR